MFEVNAFIVTYLITEIMTKFTIQQFKPFLCDQVIISEVITFTLVLISYLIKCNFLSSAMVSNLINALTPHYLNCYTDSESL